jgi:hypothetical protein
MGSSSESTSSSQSTETNLDEWSRVHCRISQVLTSSKHESGNFIENGLRTKNDSEVCEEVISRIISSTSSRPKSSGHVFTTFPAHNNNDDSNEATQNWRKEDSNRSPDADTRSSTDEERVVTYKYQHKRYWRTKKKRRTKSYKSKLLDAYIWMQVLILVNALTNVS